jgi:hypothetical protein
MIMATIDIRDEIGEIDTIVFSNEQDHCKQIERRGTYIKFVDDGQDYILVSGYDVQNLIKALQKAVELGWTK